MTVSRNLVLQLIANSLKMQFFGQSRQPMKTTSLPPGRREKLLEQLDSALQAKDPQAAGQAWQALFDLNRESMLKSLQAANTSAAAGG